MYVSEVCDEGIFVTFPWWLKNVESRSKIALSSNERHFEIWFPKKRTITFFWSKLSKLHKKDPIFDVATTFSLKQGETRTSHGPIPHPLRRHCVTAATHMQACTHNERPESRDKKYGRIPIFRCRRKPDCPEKTYQGEYGIGKQSSHSTIC